jgi:hypothetical protein
MKLAGNASHFPNSQHQLQYTVGLQVGEAFTQVVDDITDEGITPADVSATIMVLEMAFGDPDHVMTVELKLEILKQTHGNFSNYCKGFQGYGADVQWNDPAKCTALMRILNNEIKDALALSDNVLQQFWEFIAFLQRLDN